MNHAGNYGGMLHDISKAVEAAQSTDGAKVVAKMKELPDQRRYLRGRTGSAKTGGTCTRCTCGR